MTDFFISDTHFGHENIMKFCNRPFESVEDMTEQMIAKWNAKVTADDAVYHLGDFAFGRGTDSKFKKSIFERLNGRKILIVGNHDHSDVRSLPWAEKHVRLNYKGYMPSLIVLDHYPLFDWDQRYHGSLHFYGHVHNNPVGYNPDKNAYNLSCELRGYEPCTVQEILAQGPLPSV